MLTIAPFLALVISKFTRGTVADLTSVRDEGGFGEVMLMIGIMVAFQAEIIWRRGRALGARESSRTEPKGSSLSLASTR